MSRADFTDSHLEEMEKRDIQQGSGYALDGVLRTIQGHVIHAKERLSALKEIKPELSGSLLQAEQAVETLLSLDMEISSYIEHRAEDDGSYG